MTATAVYGRAESRNISIRSRLPSKVVPRYMLLGGSGIFRLASELFGIVKLNYWSKIMDNYVTILERLDRPDKHVGRSSGSKRKGKKKIDVKAYLRLPSRKVMTTRRPEWREVAKTCGKLGHWIQHHTFECVNNRICREIEGSAFCVKSYAQMLMQYKIQLTMDMYNSSLNLINRHFREELILLDIPDSKEDYVKMRKKVDLAPRLYNAIVRHRKGTSTLISYLNRGIYTSAAVIQAS